MEQGAGARIVGHVRFGPDVKTSKAGNNFSQMKVSVTDARSGKDSTFRVVMFGDAHKDAEGLNLGDLVQVKGRLEVNRWKDDSGKWLEKIDVVANSIEVLRASRAEAPPPDFPDDDLPF